MANQDWTSSDTVTVSDAKAQLDKDLNTTEEVAAREVAARWYDGAEADWVPPFVAAYKPPDDPVYAEAPT